jgi:hypothetical protein
MARCVIERREAVGKPRLLPSATAGGQCGRGADKTSEHERTGAAEEAAYTALPACHRVAFLSCRPAGRSTLEKLSPVTLATYGRRVK